MTAQTMQPLSAKHPDREWGSCQDLSITSCIIINGTVLQLSSGSWLFITALMTADECFDGILHLIYDPVTTLISDIRDSAVIRL